MIKFFYDSLETLQKVKFATKKDYISLWLWVVFAIIVCWFFFIGVDTLLSGAYKTFYSVMKSDTLENQIYDDTTLSWALLSWDVKTITWSDSSTGVVVTPSTGS